ncbi:MAG: hypothetical protein EHM86_01440 [Desulfobulbaceae bacterium]|nr:MAG: hypothetical protein EHM86_01440 [Desulfobulbaceae bacterium]
MKRKLVLLLGACLVVTCASSAFAAATLKRLGDHPFYRPPLTSEADLRTMIEKNDADLQAGFVKAGYPELYPEFRQKFPAAKVESVSIAPGEDLAWMLFRTNGTGPVTVVRDVTWNGEAAFEAFSFSIVMQGQRYGFIVPAVCGNLSLRTVDTVAETLTNKDPICTMTLSNSEIACGQVVIADASGSSDSDGTIAQVVFQLLDEANTVVAEKSDTEAPFIQEFTIPCDSPRYTIKTVVIDNSGAASSSADCTKAVTVAVRKGGPVVDIGLSHQFDPASYAFARVGYEYPLTEKLSAMGLIGGFARFDGDDGDDAVFVADALLNFAVNEKMFIGGGVGFWSGNDGKADLIVNTGYLIHEKPGGVKTSLFVEGRCEAEDMISSNAARLGAGLRFQF